MTRTVALAIALSLSGCAAAYNAIAKPASAEQTSSARFLGCAAKDVAISDEKARPAGGTEWTARCTTPSGPVYRCELASATTGVTCSPATAPASAQK